MIQISDLSLTAGNFRIDHLNLDLREGVFNILLGPTGSGKTLILESVIGLRPLARGRVVLGGKEIQNLPPEKRGIAYLPQDLALFPHLTVRENLRYGLRAQEKTSAEDENHLERVIEALKIRHLLERHPQGLSGGEKQRVALGRALAPSPRLILLDEPLAALDPALKSEIQQLLLSLQGALRFTALYVTHDLEEAYLLGDTISVLIDGRIEQRGPREDVFLRPQTAKIARFLGFRNLFPAEVRPSSPGGGAMAIAVWGKEIILPREQAAAGLTAGERVILYLRPEEVLVLREGKPIKEILRPNILEGSVARILDRGAYQWILFRPSGMDISLEIHLPNYVFRNLSLAEGQTIRVAMRKESFWVMPDEHIRPKP
jgi:ABC-type Fe3+/spermidine/putrescine transport system ATPase subunit